MAIRSKKLDFEVSLDGLFSSGFVYIEDYDTDGEEVLAKTTLCREQFHENMGTIGPDGMHYFRNKLFYCSKSLSSMINAKKFIHKVEKKLGLTKKTKLFKVAGHKELYLFEFNPFWNKNAFRFGAFSLIMKFGLTSGDEINADFVWQDAIEKLDYYNLNISLDAFVYFIKKTSVKSEERYNSISGYITECLPSVRISNEIADYDNVEFFGIKCKDREIIKKLYEISEKALKQYA